MRLTCPHCQQPIDVVPDQLFDLAVTCPACGSSVPCPEADAETRPMTEELMLGHFQLLEKVGMGQFGEVWKAHDLELDRIVAIKIPRKEELEPGELAMFLREARSAAQLQHDHIVAIYEVASTPRGPFLVCQFVSGPNLSDWLQTHPVSHREAADMTAILADALQHAHERGVIHRDVKPSNILVAPDGRLLVSDFGLAKRNAGEATITMQGKILGTPAYMSPEQARGDGHLADARSDVYSLGVVLYEMLCGTRPFKGNSKMHLLQQVLNDEPPAPRQVNPHTPRDLETICLRALDKEPDKRFPTAAELAADLRRWLAGEPIASRPISPVARGIRWVRRNRTTAALGAFAAVCAALALGMAFTPREPAIATRRVEIATSLPNTQVALIPLSPVDGLPNADRKVVSAARGGICRLNAPPGDYLVVAWEGDAATTTLFHEVLRHVPAVEEGPERLDAPSRRWSTLAGNVVQLAPVRLFETADLRGDMALVSGTDQFTLGVADSLAIPLHQRRIPPFRLDVAEATVGSCRQGLDGMLPDRLRERAAELADDAPLVELDHDFAVMYAESTGKRLVDEAEFEFAATAGGTREIPWEGDVTTITAWSVAGNPEDVVNFDRPVRGLFSGVAEWTGSWFARYPPSRHLGGTIDPREMRTVRGGDPEFIGEIPPGRQAEAQRVWHLGARTRVGMFRAETSRVVGFRCARSLTPRLTPRDFPLPVE